MTAQPRQDPRIVFIAGTGHSGSTLLDLLLTTHSKIFSAGEAKDFTRWPDQACTCSAAHWRECSFWTRVDEEMRTSGTGLGHADLEARDPEAFSAYNRRFFRAIANQSACPIVIDSSKDYSRLRSFLRSDLSVEVVYLVRDARGVALSHVRKGRNALTYAKKHVHAHVRIAHALHSVTHIEVHYEDLARHPAHEVTRVLEFLGLELEPNQLEGWRDHERHNFGGNRMRRSDTSEIRLDEEWRTQLGSWERLVIGTRALPTRVRSRWGTTLLRRLF